MFYNLPLTDIDERETRRYAGLSRAVFDESMIRAACDEALALASPRGVSYEYGYEAGKVMAEPPVVIEGEMAPRHLLGAERVVCLAVTVGEAIEEAVTRHFEEGSYAYSVLLDAAATAATEQTADAMERALRPGIFARGLRMRSRYSPGYGDWPLFAQPDMVRLSRAGDIGISLTESLMLFPRKSVTAIIGLARTKADDCRDGCADCAIKDCPSRRV